MSETREQFRYRLGEVSFQGRGLDSFDWKEAYEHSFDADHDMDAAEAVYAQALRDVYQHAASLPLDMDQITVQEMVEAFAAERGIDLEDES